ncbi:hypothetical protein GCM10022631_16260 [Deinococcus rubellus]
MERCQVGRAVVGKAIGSQKTSEEGHDIEQDEDHSPKLGDTIFSELLNSNRELTLIFSADCGPWSDCRHRKLPAMASSEEMD